MSTQTNIEIWTWRSIPRRIVALLSMVLIVSLMFDHLPVSGPGSLDAAGPAIASDLGNGPSSNISLISPDACLSSVHCTGAALLLFPSADLSPFLATAKLISFSDSRGAGRTISPALHPPTSQAVT